MNKWEIEGELNFLAELKTNTLTAEEDLIVLRLIKSLSESLISINDDKKAIVEKAQKDGVVFGDNGQPDMEKSDKEALEKANEKIRILLSEDVDVKVLDISIIHKLKNDNLDKLGNVISFANFATKYLKET